MKIDNLEILNGLIAGAEGGTVEFKETTGQLERGMETLCAFLNGTGGTVLFGVTDKGKIIGQEVSDKTKRDIAETIRRIEPFATIDISYTDIPEVAIRGSRPRYKYFVFIDVFRFGLILFRLLRFYSKIYKFISSSQVILCPSFHHNGVSILQKSCCSFRR